ncbi:prohibitin family protein [Pseudoalteromonas sp. S16_S37]|uniref:prohibitin family protein n=1 Tax=Pseudoalteromonas sp. S16_S37 TaxID=2720228 RepID=UPI0016800458|nr:prohibitin family protein [Pseudoalteromonas sp. S16_S37]MBD1582666.1 prohibitin family protein [Pseudoalteromonas sp. S16_S37]
MNIIIPPDIGLLVLGALCLVIVISNIVMRVLKRYYPKLRKRIVSWRFRAGVTLLILLFLIVALVPVVFIKVDSGEVGVLWKRLGGGTYLDKPFSEGTVLVMPWDKLVIYSSRFQTANREIHAITNQGLRITLDVTVRYRPVVKHIPFLHQLVGQDYVNEMVIPEVSSAVRVIVSNYTAEEVYGSQRMDVQAQLLGKVLNELKLQEQTILKGISGEMKGHALVNLDDVLIRRVNVPEGVHNAIIAKVNQHYLQQEYDMRLEVAEKEAMRKETEAKGIAAFQKTVSGGISETYLRWRGIEATIELAKSNNAKVVVIGGGKDGLPLILNTENSLGPSLPAVSHAKDDKEATEKTNKETKKEPVYRSPTASAHIPLEEVAQP